MKFILRVLFYAVYTILGVIAIAFSINCFFAMSGYQKRYGENWPNKWYELLMDGLDELNSY